MISPRTRSRSWSRVSLLIVPPGPVAVVPAVSIRGPWVHVAERSREVAVAGRWPVAVMRASSSVRRSTIVRSPREWKWDSWATASPSSISRRRASAHARPTAWSRSAWSAWTTRARSSRSGRRSSIPERDVSAGHIHGITARDVYGAPHFGEVAGLLTESLRGRVLVAHNLSFEAQFLMGEFGRLGHDLQLDRGSGICTMTLASTYIPHSPRNLQACCDCCGVELRDAHSALADARATTQLLGRYIGVDADFADRWSHCSAASLPWSGRRSPPTAAASSHVAKPSQATWPTPTSAGSPRTCRRSAAPASPTAISRCSTGRSSIASWRCTRWTSSSVWRVTSGLSREQTDIAHRDYLDALVRQAWSDGRADRRGDRGSPRRRGSARHRRVGAAGVHPGCGGGSGRAGRLRLRPARRRLRPRARRPHRLHRRGAAASAANSCATRPSRWVCGR